MVSSCFVAFMSFLKCQPVRKFCLLLDLLSNFYHLMALRHFFNRAGRRVSRGHQPLSLFHSRAADNQDWCTCEGRARCCANRQLSPLGCSYILIIGLELMPARTACPTIKRSPEKNFRHISQYLTDCTTVLCWVPC